MRSDQISSLWDSSSLLNTWYHLTTVLSGQTGRIYVNGNMTAESSSPMTPPTNTVKTKCRIGSIHEWTGPDVAIDELKFYDRALSEAEILRDYNLNGSIV